MSLPSVSSEGAGVEDCGELEVTIWFSSDHHFRHTNTWALFKNPDGTPLRPFTSTEEMDECMIQRHNEVVKPSDHWYCLGDVSMMRPRFVARQLNALNGHKRLIRGNHDIYKTKEYLEFFDEVYGIRVIDNILFTHIPVHPRCMGGFAANVHGHIHAGPDLEPAVGLRGKEQKVVVMPYINIVVEKTDYRPVSLEELKTEASYGPRPYNR